MAAPDLRGYNTSDKPPRVRDYRPRVLDQQAAHGLRLVGNHHRRQPAAKARPRRLIELDDKPFDVVLFPQEPVKVPSGSARPARPRPWSGPGPSRAGPARRSSHQHGTVSGLSVTEGQSVPTGATIADQPIGWPWWVTGGPGG